MTETSHASQFDTGPLSWVMGEIRDALGRSRAALEEAAGREGDAQATSLQHAKSHLHQAHGALQIVDVEGTSTITEAAEEAIDRFKSGALVCDAGNARIVAEAYQAVVEYLDELLAGTQPAPARFFPYYRDLKELLKAERIHPADLLFADISVPANLPPHEAAAAPDYAAYRARFEKALLPFLKNGNASHAQKLYEAVRLVADAQAEPKARAFWFAMQSFAELVATNQLSSDVYVKQLFGQINLQIRRLSQGKGELPEPMLRDALFFIAAAAHPSENARALRSAFRLEGMVPPDYNARRYGRIDAEALKTAKDALAEAKTTWDRLASEIDGTLEERFERSLEAFQQASDKLGAPALTQLLSELGRVAKDSIKSGRNEQFSMEMAAAMLFIEHGLDQIRQLPGDFNDHAETVGARLLALAAGETPPDAPDWQGDLSRQIQQGQTVNVLAEEMRVGLRQVEKVLDDYYADSSKRPSLASIDAPLHQLQGALAILDQEDAMRAAQHVKQAVRGLAAAEGNPELDAKTLENIAKNVGALGFFIDTLAHNPDAARERFEFAAGENLFRSVPFGRSKIESAPADAEAPSAPAPAPVVEAPVVTAPPVVVQAEDVDAELLEIFISEAQEVLAFVCEHLPAAHAEPSNQETLTKLRRSFHTLKGSGRMVGLNQFGDAAHGIEKVMNVWLTEARTATPDLLALLDRASVDMSAWVEELVATGKSARTCDALVAAAARVQDGQPFSIEEAEPATAEVIEMPLPQETAPSLELVDLSAPIPQANVIEFPTTAPPPAPPADDHTKHIGELEIALPLYNIYLAETDELVRVLTRDFSEWRHEPARAVSADALKASHTLAGTSGTVGFKSLRELAYAMEMALKMLVAPAPQLQDAQRMLLEASLETARDMLQRFATGDLAPAQPELVQQLQQLREQLAASQANAVFGDASPELAQKLDSLFAQAMDELVAAPPVFETPAPKPGLPPVPESVVSEIDNLFDTAFEDPFEAPVLTQVAPPAEASAEEPAAELAEELLDAPAEELPVVLAEELPEVPAEELPEVPAEEAAEEPAPEPIELAAPPVAPVESAPQVFEAEPFSEPAPEPIPAAPIMVGGIADDLDADLLPVFIEEGSDLLPEVGNALRAWQQNPADTAAAKSVQRTLHTIKGSARMAGAMRLGQHTHDIETQIENMVHAGTTTPAAFDELMANYDHALFLFEQLQSPQPVAAAAIPADAATQVPGAQPSAPAMPKTLDDLHAAQSRTPLVRVRADILDRLVNQAGEVSITRSKLETQIASVRTSLSEFTENLTRLRSQLREVEMQAESQIASRMSIAGEREFDPLEFDRFTRLQELTRMMAESVNDVASFHESLTRTVDSASGDLGVQTRLTRDLQQDLMRVRMVPFSSLSERLFRVARQSAKEMDKRVNLDIRGGNVEIDRSVLEQMAAPFEHLLRNSIVHGIESRAARVDAGKPETGEVLVQVSQQGNEVVLQFSDDGGGLNLERIRAKARQNGLLHEGQVVSDAEAADLIFEPGFSTAEELTELAGRGVGMDVVRSEAQSLGGRVSIDSTSGKGAHFTIHLPLTLAVTQVVLTASAGKTYALPSILVEQVLQMKEGPLAEAHKLGHIQHQGSTISLHYLPTLLGDLEARPLSQRSSSVFILRNGADRIALHVDDIVGNREVVVKNIGPQLARMIGIAGATVLGSGDIVLILNPVALAHHYDHHPELREHFVSTGAPAPELLARNRVVMVVDDSLTVRKVTQRLLEREGYQVVLAKDGVDALEQIQEARPDLMLVDIEMPRMDGFDLTRNIRGSDSTKDIPIIMITSRTADKHRNYALELGVNAYFGKPFQEDILVAAISGLLA